MVKDIVKYPTTPSVEFGTDVRLFNEELFSIIEDLKDTIIENNLDGLVGYQIGYYFNVIVIKDENGEFLELINPLKYLILVFSYFFIYNLLLILC